MGSSASVRLLSFALVTCSTCSHAASNEGYEGDEDRWCQEGRRKGHDSNSSLQFCSVQHGLEGQGREGRRGGLHVSRSRATEEERVLQVRRRVEFEVEEEACDADCEGPCTEEIQGRGQLICLSSCPRC